MMENVKHFFYVVECCDGSLYAGYSTDVVKRVKKHNEGKGAKYTRARKPVVLRYTESFLTKREALQREIEFKKFKRLKKLMVISQKSDERFG